MRINIKILYNQGVNLGGVMTVSNSQLPLRHSMDGGYARGEETRKRILNAALKVFAEKGYDAATTRLIANRAGVNPPALQYYFENKEGVFNRCIEMVAIQNIGILQPILEEMHRAAQEEANDDSCISLLCDFTETMLHRVFTMKNAKDIHLFIAHIHLQQGPAQAFQILRNIFEIPLYDAISSIVAKLSRLPSSDEVVQLRVLSLMGLLNIFITMRPSVLAQMNWDVINDQRLMSLITVTRTHCAILIKSWINDSP